MKNDNGVWIRESAGETKLFAKYQKTVFQPNEIISDITPNKNFTGDYRIKHASPLEVAQILDKLVSSKAPSPDNINADMVSEM